MKNADIYTLGKVLLALENYLPIKEKPLFDEYFAVYERLNTKNTREKQSYQDKAEYYRDYSRKRRAKKNDARGEQT